MDLHANHAGTPAVDRLGDDLPDALAVSRRPRRLRTALSSGPKTVIACEAAGSFPPLRLRLAAFQS